jgi:hypothetical protein
VRDGPQVDVERVARRPAARLLPHGRGPAARRRARSPARPLRDLRPHRRPPHRRVGRAARPEARHPDPGGRLRRALGRARRRRPPASSRSATART